MTLLILHEPPSISALDFGATGFKPVLDKLIKEEEIKSGNSDVKTLTCHSVTEQQKQKLQLSQWWYFLGGGDRSRQINIKEFICFLYDRTRQKCIFTMHTDYFASSRLSLLLDIDIFSSFQIPILIFYRDREVPPRLISHMDPVP